MTQLLGISNGSASSGGSSTPVHSGGGQVMPCQRHRVNSISSTGSSPPSDAPHSPGHLTTTTKNTRRQRDFFSDSRTRHELQFRRPVRFPPWHGEPPSPSPLQPS